MPIFRYFIFAGGLLLSLLFIANYYLPPLAAQPTAKEIDKSVIRVHAADRNAPPVFPSPSLSDQTFPVAAIKTTADMSTEAEPPASPPSPERRTAHEARVSPPPHKHHVARRRSTRQPAFRSARARPYFAVRRQAALSEFFPNAW